jgi:hypothetical protein
VSVLCAVDRDEQSVGTELDKHRVYPNGSNVSMEPSASNMLISLAPTQCRFPLAQLG